MRKWMLLCMLAAAFSVVCIMHIQGISAKDVAETVEYELESAEQEPIHWHYYNEGEGLYTFGNKMPSLDGAINDTIISAVQAAIKEAYAQGVEGNAREELIQKLVAEEIVKRVDVYDERPSPALLAVFCADADMRYAGTSRLRTPILQKQKGATGVEKARAAMREFLQDDTYARLCFVRWKRFWDENVKHITIAPLNAYGSSWYMEYDGQIINGEAVPLIRILNSTHTGGTGIFIFLVDRPVWSVDGWDDSWGYVLRDDCGLQPVDPEAPSEKGPPHSDNPPKDEPPKKDNPPKDEPPEDEKKDPNGGLQGEGNPKSDVGGQDRMEKTEQAGTEEKAKANNPTTYKPPEPPEPQKASDASAGTETGSSFADTKNGEETEKGVRQAGDGKDHGDFTEGGKNPPPEENGSGTFEEDWSGPE